MKEEIKCPKCGNDWIESKIDAMLHEMNIGNGSMDVKMSSPLFRIYAAAIADIFVSSGAPNFITTGMFDSRSGLSFNLTIERIGGKSTGEIIGELKEKIKQLNAACQNHILQQTLTGSPSSEGSPKLPEEPATSVS